MSELSWRVYPRLYVVALLWALPIFLVLLMLTGFSWIILTCALLLAVLSLVLSASALRISVSGGMLRLRYWFYLVEVDIADITEVVPASRERSWVSATSGLARRPRSSSAGRTCRRRLPRARTLSSPCARTSPPTLRRRSTPDPAHQPPDPPPHTVDPAPRDCPGLVGK